MEKLTITKAMDEVNHGKYFFGTAEEIKPIYKAFYRNWKKCGYGDYSAVEWVEHYPDGAKFVDDGRIYGLVIRTENDGGFFSVDHTVLSILGEHVCARLMLDFINVA